MKIALLFLALAAAAFTAIVIAAGPMTATAVLLLCVSTALGTVYGLVRLLKTASEAVENETDATQP